MNNYDAFKELRVALQLREDQIVEIMQLVDFRIAKAELGTFFRNADHPDYMDCGDQVLRSFLTGLIIHLRGTKDAPKNPKDVLAQNKAAVSKAKPKKAEKPAQGEKTKLIVKSPAKNMNFKAKSKKTEPVVEKFKFKDGKNKKA